MDKFAAFIKKFEDAIHEEGIYNISLNSLLFNYFYYSNILYYI